MHLSPRVLLAAGFLVGGLVLLQQAAPRVEAQRRRPAACPAGSASDGRGHCVGTHTCPAGMVPVPAGQFEMGKPGATDDRGPVHSVQVWAFCMDRLEVTTADYRACVAAGRCQPTQGGSACNEASSGYDRHPINCVSFPQAEAYCQQRGARLPTEAEWEYAARGTDGRRYPWGNTAPSPARAWTSLRGRLQTRTAVVGRRPAGASPFGIEDMSGNVCELVAGVWSERYDQAPGTNPNTLYRVCRGGSLNNRDLESLESTFRRHGYNQSSTDELSGVRCAANATGTVP